MKPAAVADALLPGSGLLVDGRPAWGLALLVPAVLCLSALLLALIISGFAAAWVLPRALPLYVLLALTALAVRWRFAQLARLDPAATQRLARAASRAWLRDEPEAATIAQALTRAAPELAQAWRLRALVTGEAKALKRAEAIERR